MVTRPVPTLMKPDREDGDLGSIAVGILSIIDEKQVQPRAIGPELRCN
jgi:hypothetical protein